MGQKKRTTKMGLDFWRSVERPFPDFATRRTSLRLAGPALWLPLGRAGVLGG
jgi:hypothetical protein